MGHIRQRTKGGNFQAIWTDIDGKRKRRSTLTNDPVAARTRLREFERDESVWRPPAFTVARACAYAGKVQLDKTDSEAWRQRCAKAVVQHIFPILGQDTDLNGVNIPKLVNDYIEARRSHKGPTGEPIAKSTIRKELLILRQGCEEGQICDEFFGNLKQIVPKHLSKKGPQRSVRLTLDQANKLIEVATPHRRPWLVWAIHSGVDIGATHKILKTDVDLERGRYGVVYIPDTKNEYRPRPIPLTPESRWAVDVRMRAPGEYLFRPVWSSQAFSKCMARWCPKADIPERIRWKDLRRTTASMAGERGASELVMGKFFGWSGSSEMLKKVYLHLDESAFHEMVERLPALRVPGMCQAASVGAGESQHNSGNVEISRNANTLQNMG
jgi:hypothetical protein